MIDDITVLGWVALAFWTAWISLVPSVLKWSYTLGRKGHTWALLFYELWLLVGVVGAIIWNRNGFGRHTHGWILQNWLLGTAISIVVVLCWWLLLAKFPRPSTWIKASGSRWRLAVGLNFWIAFGEEVVFRFLLAGGMLAVGADWWLVILISAAVFGGYHYQPYGFRGAFAHAGLGIILSVVFVFYGLFGAIIGHCLYNYLATTFMESRRSRMF